MKDIKQLFNPITKKNKRIELEKRNAMASLKIAAAKTIKKTENYAEIDAFKAEIKAQLKAKKYLLTHLLRVMMKGLKLFQNVEMGL